MSFGIPWEIREINTRGSKKQFWELLFIEKKSSSERVAIRSKNLALSTILAWESWTREISGILLYSLRLYVTDWTSWWKIFSFPFVVIGTTKNILPTFLITSTGLLKYFFPWDSLPRFCPREIYHTSLSLIYTRFFLFSSSVRGFSWLILCCIFFFSAFHASKTSSGGGDGWGEMEGNIGW